MSRVQVDGCDGSVNGLAVIAEDTRDVASLSSLASLRRSRHIAARFFVAGKVEKEHHSIVLVFEMMHNALPGCSNAAPAPDEAGLSEQASGDFHGIEPGHVLRRVRSFCIDMIGLVDHTDRFADPAFLVQREL